MPRFALAVLLLLTFAPLQAQEALTPISQIQGTGSHSPLAGQRVKTHGVVTLLTNAGFFMQDAAGDGDPATSDGIYVFTGREPAVAPGDRVEVQAEVSEYQAGKGAAAQANPLTELTRPQIRVLAHGTPPEPLRIDYSADDAERHEGVLVRMSGPFTVLQNYFLGRYGQLLLGQGERQFRPTERFPPGSREAIALAADNARRRILLDDASSRQNPGQIPFFDAAGTRRLGDTVRELVGVIDVGLAGPDSNGPVSYRLQPARSLVFESANPRPASPPAPAAGAIRVASMNLQNWFITLDQPGAHCSPARRRGDARAPAGECRGANTADELERQRAKLLAAVQGLDADVIGLLEVENDGNVAVDALVAALNVRPGAAPYASLPLPAGGTGEDAIRVAMIYRPARVQPDGQPQSDVARVHGRPPLLQSFSVHGGRSFSVLLAHLKSKSRCPQDADSADADQGDGQGCWNARRSAQAQALVRRLETLRRAGEGDVLLLGDFNAYSREDPLRILSRSGLRSLIAPAAEAYSYAFDGEIGSLDHALVTEGLASRVLRASHWHINADEPPLLDYNHEFRQPLCERCAPDGWRPDAYRSADHDPLYIDLRLR